MEIGIGIHGEKGIHREEVKDIVHIVGTLLDELYKEVTANEVIVMVNGMGGTPLSELNIVTKYIQQIWLQERLMLLNGLLVII